MAICVAGNRFSLKGIRAKLNGKNGTAETDVGFARAALYKKSFWAPSVMGPFSYLPMPCSHAVVSLRHSVTGSHTVCGENYPIDGFGYIEKDFGKSFPANYVWVQGFLGDTSVIAAVAWPLPLIKRGFLCLILHAGVQYNLSLYTGAKLTVSELSPESARFTLKKRDCSVSFDIRRASAVSLSAPEKGGVMNAVIEESLCAEAKIDLTLNGRKIAVSRVVPVTFESVNRPEKS